MSSVGYLFNQKELDMPFDSTDYKLKPIDPVLQRLIEGRARLVKGWCQNSLRTENKVCARGAIHPDPYVSFRGWYSADKTARDADKWLARFVPRGVVIFNNDPKTSKKDVIALFDLAIAARIEMVCLEGGIQAQGSKT